MLSIDLEKLRTTPLETDPYDFLIVPEFLKRTALPGIEYDYPAIKKNGSFPLSSLQYGPAFGLLIEELSSEEVRHAFGRKFNIDLKGKPLTITVRGHSHAKDGRIHTDTESKILTLLIYMNTEWQGNGGRLRILRSELDIEDYKAEIPPAAGTLLAFRRSESSWHGHKTFEGERKVIQLNWVTSEDVVRNELRRHRLSAFLKSINPFGNNRKTSTL
jgi:SM-20-related protein